MTGNSRPIFGTMVSKPLHFPTQKCNLSASSSLISIPNNVRAELLGRNRDGNDCSLICDIAVFLLAAGLYVSAVRDLGPSDAHEFSRKHRGSRSGLSDSGCCLASASGQTEKLRCI